MSDHSVSVDRGTKIDVSALAKKLQVSQVTIRKDLDELERRGIVIREHGFARLCSEENRRIPHRLSL